MSDKSRLQIGLDLGRERDHSALVAMLRQGDYPNWLYEVHAIQKWPLGVSYTTIVNETGEFLTRIDDEYDWRLVVDRSGVGAGVYEMFTQAGIRACSAVITGGTGHRKEDYNHWFIAKIELVGVVIKVLEQGRLRMNRQIPQAGYLEHELRNFRVKVTKSANEVYEAREGGSDDIVLAAALGLYVSEAEGPGACWLVVTPEMEAEAQEYERRLYGYNRYRGLGPMWGRSRLWDG